MTTSSRVARKAVVHTLMIATAAAAVLVLSPAASAQDQARFGTADEAKAMLMKAVTAVKADRARAFALFRYGQGGYLDRDLYPFCANIVDGKFVVLNNRHAHEYLDRDIRTLKDSNGKAFGWEQFTAAQKPEGEVTEVSYLVPNSGVHTTPLPKVSVTTRVGDLICGVSYYRSPIDWAFDVGGLLTAH
jgi:hypothetical protein